MAYNFDKLDSLVGNIDDLLIDDPAEAENSVSDQYTPPVSHETLEQLTKSASELLHPDANIRNIIIRTDV